jgi:hypothetical protein
MTLMDMYGKIAAQIQNITSVREVQTATNRVISDINAKWPGEVSTDHLTRLVENTEESVTFSTGGDNDTMQTTTNMQAAGVGADSIVYVSGSNYPVNNGQFSVVSCSTNVVSVDLNSVLEPGTATVTVSAFTLVNELYPDTSSTTGKAYVINARKNEFTMDPKVKKILGIFVNDIELDYRDREFTMDDDNETDPVYTMVARNTIALPSSIFSAAEDIMSIKMLKQIPALSDATTTGIIDIPTALEGLLFSGVMVCLLAKPQYENDSLMKLNSAFYSTELTALSGQEIERYENVSREVSYKY